MKILMAVDGSEYTRRMTGFVEAHDELFPPGTEFTLLTMVLPLPDRAAAFMSQQSIESYYQNAADEVFVTVRNFVNQRGAKARFHHRVGHAAEGVATLAQQEHFDLVMLGSHGHSTLGNLVLGSVATGVLSRCKTPALIVR